MKKASILLLLFPLQILTVKAQDDKDLFYAQPPNSALYMGLIPVKDNLAVLAGRKQVLLLGENRILRDTLYLNPTDKDSFEHYINHIALTDEGFLSISTYFRGLLVNISDEQFYIEKDIRLTKEVEKDLMDRLDKKGRINYVVVDEDGILVRLKGKKSEHYYISKNSQVSNNMTPHHPDITRYMKSRVIGFNKYQYVGDSILHWNRKKNRLFVFDKKTNKTSDFTPKKLKNPKKEIYEYYYDPLMNQHYLHLIREDGKNEIGKLDMMKKTILNPISTKFIIRGVFNSHYYVSGIVDGVRGHFLIPETGKNPDVNKLDEVEVKK